MDADQLLALAAFAAVASFTPGPNNAIATVTGARFGFRAVLPHMLGVPAGFSAMLLAAAGGLAALLLAAPMLAGLLKWLGVGYLLWLSWQLARDDGRTSAAAGGPFALPLGFAQSAAFQFLNPKAWMFALAVTTAFAAGEPAWTRTATVVAICASASLASLVAWGWIGAALRGWLARGRRLRAFNAAMAVLLAATALWMGLSG